MLSASVSLSLAWQSTGLLIDIACLPESLNNIMDRVIIQLVLCRDSFKPHIVYKSAVNYINPIIQSDFVVMVVFKYALPSLFLDCFGSLEFNLQLFSSELFYLFNSLFLVVEVLRVLLLRVNNIHNLFFEIDDVA